VRSEGLSVSVFEWVRTKILILMRQPVDANVLAELEEMEIAFWMLNTSDTTQHSHCTLNQCLKWGGKGAQPPAPIWAAIVWAPLIESIKCEIMPKYAKLVGWGMGMGLLQPGFVSWAPLLHMTTLTIALNCTLGFNGGQTPWMSYDATNPPTRSIDAVIDRFATTAARRLNFLIWTV